MTKPSLGWAVQISGNPYDLAALKVVLAPPGNPWVEEDTSNKEVLLLRSTEWADFSSNEQVHAAATILVERINATLPMVTPNAEKIAMGAVYNYKSDGTRDTAVFFQAVSMIAATGRILLVVDGVAQPIVQGDIRKALAGAATDPKKADLLVYLTHADNWFDIYKAAEIVRHLAGGEKALEADLKKSNDWNAWKLVTQTANFHRHVPGLNFEIPKVLASLGPARDIVTRIAYHYL